MEIKYDKLLKIDDLDKLEINQLKEMYINYVSPSIEKVLSYFDSGNIIFEKAQGVYLYSEKGEKILDYTGGLGVLNHGHNHPRIINARIEFQKKNRVEVNKLNFSKYTAALSYNIAKLLDDKLKYSFFCNSGAEAVEGSIKTAFKFHESKRKILLHSNISYHGKTIGSGSISNQNKDLFPTINNTDKFVYNDVSSLETLIDKYKKDIYAIIVEPLNASGLFELSYDYLKYLRNMCNKYNIILIFDEIFTGWFKSNKLFHFLNYKDIYPDILAVSKSLGGGKSSISAFISSEIVFKKAYKKTDEAFLHTSTYNGFGEECFTAIEAIQVCLDEEFENKTNENFNITKNRLNKLYLKHQKYIQEIRFAGGLAGIIFKYNFLFDFVKKDNFLAKKLSNINFMKKIISASILNELFSKYKILAYVNEKKINNNDNNSYDIILNLNPSIVIKPNEIHYFYDSLDKILSQKIEKIVLRFALKNIK